MFCYSFYLFLYCNLEYCYARSNNVVNFYAVSIVYLLLTALKRQFSLSVAQIKLTNVRDFINSSGAFPRMKMEPTGSKPGAERATDGDEGREKRRVE